MQGIALPGKAALLSVSVLYALAFNAAAEESAEINFDASFLRLGNGQVPDLTRFSRGASLSPGIHRVRVFFNEQPVVNQDVLYVTEGQRSVPCLSTDLLRQLPLRHEKLPASAYAVDAGTCISLATLIPDATVTTDSNAQTLNILVPQVWEDRSARDTVPAALWDSGIPAALLGYSLNAYSSENSGYHHDSLYASLNGGINIGSWYLRHNGNWSRDNHTGSRYQTQNTYLQRDIPPLKGRISVGQINTSGQLFDTQPFSGLKIESDERMEPLSRRGYAPEIRGIARTSARVTVRQNDSLIYETTVSPGTFIIDDLYPTGYGGDLDVTVYEADGSEQHFQVPFASVTQLLRPGQSRYELSVGELNNRSLHSDPTLWQGTWQQGLNNWLTVYGGIQGSDHYRAGQGGVGIATRFGAVSADITQARTSLGNTGRGDVTRQGKSYRLSYNKNITETASNVALAAYRFSTRGYMDYLTAMQTRETVAQDVSADSIRRSKSRYTLTASQGLPGGWGQIYLSSSVQNYWNAGGIDKQYQFGYSNNFNRVSYGINAGRSWSAYGRSQDTLSLNLSFPLGNTRHAPTGRLSYDHTRHAGHSLRTGINGSAGEDNRFSYGLSGTATSQGVGNSATANTQYRADFASLNAALGSGRHYRSVSGGMSGTVIGHSGGLTLSPYQGDTFALVEAKGAEGAGVNGYSAIQIDNRGYAAVPYMSPYQLNDIRLDPKGTASGVELENTSQKVAPHEGAVVKISYQTRRGYPVLIKIMDATSPLIFGTEVYDAAGQAVGYVGQGRQIYARVDQISGVLNVSVGSRLCQLPYALAHADSGKLESVSLRCEYL
ncbi:TPA: fimbria/pilus outer membrane usher protein [Klebsiella oxytoca]|uniref:fimbria/pilus outer membrane usher protein n=1 Tax=Klebsiella pneumoniae TaxID=573 RepID=UPI000E2AC68E|nr:fimbria/pilus outer membrane usher protein [Klebsiella pneumoniae]HBM2953098.1 fimbrial biogenesis outer membrane usher protein [Klebsiella oxytoca]SYA67381.1 type 1 fimbriae anchoring protein FimD [Klebsiella pneumoniae]HBM3049282.1 fimbrial biogenesis outer membrane usher protein [Klebsiella oxytoca]HEC2166222.1 fimbrial biogenesis outer membrane usher protein [Klebsiella oxytoca]HEJ0077762.1 fimbrial biogenesis outer membrane usher protein [Klebsiella oxytoca]